MHVVHYIYKNEIWIEYQANRKLGRVKEQIENLCCYQSQSQIKTEIQIQKEKKQKRKEKKKWIREIFDEKYLWMVVSWSIDNTQKHRLHIFPLFAIEPTIYVYCHVQSNSNPMEIANLMIKQ